MDVWEEARRHLDGLPGGAGFNIAHEAVDRHVLRGAGERIAFRFVGSAQTRSMSYAELAQASNRFANVLRRLNVGAGDRVFSFAGRIPELYVSAIGTLKARAVFSALYANFGEQPILTRLSKGGGKLLLTTVPLYERRIAAIRGSLPMLEHVLVSGREPAGPPTLAFDALMGEAEDMFAIDPTDPEDPAFLHFTSGTTGSPKGALHVHDAAASLYATASSVLKLRPDDVYWCTADPGWVTGISYGLVAPLLHGVTMVIDEGEFDAARWYRIIQDEQVTVLYTAPTAIRMLMKAGGRLARSFDLRSLRLIVSAGEALSPEAVRWGRQALNLDIHDTWWQTETGSIIIATGADDDVALGRIGKPVAGIKTAVARRLGDGTLQFINESDRVGELVLKAGWPSMFRGYVGEPDRYAECFSGDWYLTGDLVCRDDEGRFSFVSRGDELIKSAGHLIGPYEVESCLSEHPAVAEVGVIGKPDPLVGEVVKAFVTVREGYDTDEELRLDLLAFARQRLGSALAPREISFCRSLPKTRNGKIVRRLLRARELGLPDNDLVGVEAPEQASLLKL
jgi:acetyl-CoA synthetase